MILAIYCAGGLGRQVLDLARSVNRWDRILFVDDVTEETVCHGAPVYRFSEISRFRGRVEFVIANGEPSARRALYKKVKEAGYPLTVILGRHCEISPSAQIGEGCILFNCYLCPDVRIGNNVVIVSRVDVGHDVRVGDHCMINSMSFIGGYVRIGDSVYIAPGALLRDRIYVGASAIIGLGAVVIHDVKDRQIVAGNPAVKIGDNMEEKVFKQKNHNGGGRTETYGSGEINAFGWALHTYPVNVPCSTPDKWIPSGDLSA